MPGNPHQLLDIHSKMRNRLGPINKTTANLMRQADDFLRWIDGSQDVRHMGERHQVVFFQQ
jgi:hypothetical protein